MTSDVPESVNLSPSQFDRYEYTTDINIRRTNNVQIVRT